MLITAVVIIQSQLTPAPEDFGGERDAAVAVAAQSIDVRATGGIGPATDPPAATDPSAATDPPAPTGTPATGNSAAPDPTTEDSPSPTSDPAADSATDQGTAAGIPVALDLPTLGVHADVHPVGITEGQLEVPTDPGDVGWWTGSVAAGSPAGATIIDGHVDSAEYGAGALYRLTDLTVGDPVQVTVAGGGTVTYRVNERRSYDKETGLPAGIFGTTGTPRLVLITCGGTFDKTTGSYESNVAVFANPT